MKEYTINDAMRGYQPDPRYMGGPVKRLDIFLEDLEQCGKIYAGEKFYKYVQCSMDFKLPETAVEDTSFPIRFGTWSPRGRFETWDIKKHGGFDLYFNPSLDPETFCVVPEETV